MIKALRKENRFAKYFRTKKGYYSYHARINSGYKDTGSVSVKNRVKRVLIMSNYDIKRTLTKYVIILRILKVPWDTEPDPYYLKRFRTTGNPTFYVFLQL